MNIMPHIVLANRHTVITHETPFKIIMDKTPTHALFYSTLY